MNACIHFDSQHQVRFAIEQEETYILGRGPRQTYQMGTEAMVMSKGSMNVHVLLNRTVRVSTQCLWCYALQSSSVFATLNGTQEYHPP